MSINRIRNMNILVNGKPKEVLEEDFNLQKLLYEIGLKPEVVAIELNGSILEKADYIQRIEEGDRIEIIKFVGGG